MIIPFNAVITSLTVNGPQWPVDTALNAVLLIHIEPTRYNHIFMFWDAEMVDRRYQSMLLIPFILIHDLRDDAGISVNTSKQRIKSNKLKQDHKRCEVSLMVVPIEEICGEQEGWGLNDDDGQYKRVDR